jgi:ABC-2 type transport system ATP-binding protein
MIVFDHFHKRYDNTDIVHIAALQLPAGVYWLRGENGAGKSTLMRSVAGLIPYEGRVTVDGVDIRKQRMQYTRIVNYAEAEPLYPGFLTGNDLISFVAESKSAPDTQANDLCAALGVDVYCGNRINTYSSGMAKKLSLVLGLLGQPKLVLLDEPLITLDVHAVAILQGIIARYATNGVSFIISSHQELQPEGIAVKQLFIRNRTVEPA